MRHDGEQQARDRGREAARQGEHVLEDEPSGRADQERQHARPIHRRLPPVGVGLVAAAVDDEEVDDDRCGQRHERRAEEDRDEVGEEELLEAERAEHRAHDACDQDKRRAADLHARRVERRPGVSELEYSSELLVVHNEVVHTSTPTMASRRPLSYIQLSKLESPVVIEPT